ncbi:hypothetical protein AAG906_026250 [Vitis piasezkii]
MGGLRSEISEAIRMFKTKTLKEAISLARMKDEQLQRQRRISRPPLPTRTLPALPTPTKASPIKRLTWDEMQRRHAQRLCFNCNDKFTVGHRCQGPQLLLLEGHTKTNEIMCEEVVDENSIENQHADLIEPEISLHVLTGWSIPRTMRIKAQIGHHELEVLIDRGSTHNFHSAKMAKILQLSVILTDCLSFEWLMVAISSVREGLDLVLGVQWLEQLGLVMCNWRR